MNVLMNWIGPIRCEEKNGTYREAKADISFIGETTRLDTENTDPFFSISVKVDRHGNMHSMIDALFRPLSRIQFYFIAEVG